jgi:hypothetical protein
MFFCGGGGIVSRRCSEIYITILPRLFFLVPPRYYLTANSCYHDGYESYDWPDGWPAPSSMACGDVSPDGTGGAPEQFW